MKTKNLRQKKMVCVLLVFVLVFTSFGLIGNQSASAATTWSSATSNTTNPIYKVAYGNGMWVGAAASGKVVTSTDASTWTERTVDSSFTDTFLNITYGGGKWVVVGSQSRVYTSTDAITWTRSTITTSSVINFSGVVYANSTYVIAANEGNIYYSSDATTWTNVKPATEDLLGIAYGNSLFVAVGNNGVAYTSPDAATWTSRGPIASGNNLYAVRYLNGSFYATSDGLIATSTNGTSWTTQSISASSGVPLYDISYSNSKYVIVGGAVSSSGLILVSSNATSWTTEASNTDLDLYGIATNDNLFVIVGSSSGSAGVIRTQAITVSTDATLSNLAINQGALNPTFASGTTSYSASVDYGVTSINVTPTANQANATIKVNGTTTTSGSAQAVSLSVGSNSIPVVVTAQDGSTTKTYTINVTRAAASTDATLSALTINQGTLTPTFASGTTSYSATVDYTVTSINVTPTANQANATIKVNGTTTTSGSAQAVSLSVGSNSIPVVVTAQDGSTTQTYTITVTRASASTNANLSNFTISAGTLTPTFDAGTTSYTASVTNATTSITVTPTTSSTNATVTVNGTTVTSGSASSSIPLASGNNTISTVVTAQDGSTTKTYTLTVTRATAPSTDATLNNLAVNQGSLTPTFASGTTSYNVSVAYNVTSISITPTVNQGNATVTVNGSTTTSGSAHAVNISVGSNSIPVVVTAQDGSTTKTYTITVTRAAASTDATLSGLAVNQGTLAPTFASNTVNYSVNVVNSVSSINITPTVNQANATVTVNGSSTTSGSAQSVPLAVGSNSVPIIVTAQDGSTTKTYTIIVTRAASANATLSALSISAGTLAPTFSSTTTNYSSNVTNSTTSTTITPTSSDSNATITVNGTATTSGSSSSSIPLAVGTNTVQVAVTAQDGNTTKTYTISITRAASSNANLSGLTISAGTLSPVFASGTTSYTATVENGTTGLTVTPTVADNNATVTVNGNSVNSGTSSGNITLSTGTNTITVVVTAQNSATQTYTIQITRLQNPNLSNLTISAGTLSPTFDTNQTLYSATVEYASSSIQITPTTVATPQTLTVAGTSTTSGSAVTIPLSVGSNTIPVVITMSDGATQTYSIKVERNDITDADAVSQTYDALQIGYATGDSSNSVTQNLNLLLNGDHATMISWVSSNPDVIQNDGTVTRPSYPSSDATVTLNALIQKGSSLKVKTFTVLVKALAITDQQAVDEDTAALQVQYAPGDSAAFVTQNVGLSTTGSNNTTITWDSSNTQRISNNGTVTRSTYNEGDQTVRLTVKVTRGSAVNSKTFDLTVKAKSASSLADLKALTVNGVTLSPAFDPQITNYAMTVNNSVNSVTVTASVYSPDAKITINGNALADGGTSDPITLSVGTNVITIVVTAQNGTTETYTITIKRDKKSDSSSGSSGGNSSGGSDTGTNTGGGTGTGGTTPPTPNDFEIIVNGRQIEQIATGTLNQQSGQAVFTATVDTDKLGTLLANEGNAPQVIIPVRASADQINTVLTGEAVQILAGAQATLRIETGLGNYTLPSSQLRVQQLAGELGGNANPDQLNVNIAITRSTDAVTTAFTNRASRDNFTVVQPPVDFTITASLNGQTSAVSEFTTYVKRELPIPSDYDPNRITTAIVVDEQGNIHHVPTAVSQQGEQYYAVVNSLTNSNYGLIWNPKEFADVANHWSKTAVNDMASRLVVNGVDSTHFNPNSNVTRAEFAAILVRALGLSDTGTTSKFTDVQSSDWYMGAVATATKYNLITGYENGTFRPTQTISRQEAFVVLQRAMDIVKLQQNTGSATLSAYTDQSKVASWAQSATQAALSSGVVQGNGKLLNPTGQMSRAETATVMQRLLKLAKLI
ncbi:cadherin-like beta sandwich domain-containing protein [Paenibacillus sp. WLX1005]|uniref:cadherin-like beta sandwich domain-containing protein n=1 Tax=Paenibacillus sp. WLX1005 TaxID=3243766 RepID=UPI0039844D8D